MNAEGVEMAGWKRANTERKRKKERKREGAAQASELFPISPLPGTTSWEIVIQYSDNSVIVGCCSNNNWRFLSLLFRPPFDAGWFITLS